MKYLLSCAAAAMAIVAAAAAADAQPSLAPNPQIDITNPGYVQPTSPDLLPIYTGVKNRKVLETLALFLAPLKLPDGSKLVVKFDQCGQHAPAYIKGGPVTLCYEFVQKVEQMQPPGAVQLWAGVGSAGPQFAFTPDLLIVGPVVQGALRQVAVALLNIFDMPVWGRTDDAADRLSAFMMLQFGQVVAWETVNGTAWFLSGRVDTSVPDFSNVRGTVTQRYYTTLCIAIGGESRGAFGQLYSADALDQMPVFGALVGNSEAGQLPPSSAKTCPQQYDTIRQAFDTLFLPHLDGALLQQVMGLNWANALFPSTQ
jgi:hypothetical protein